MSKFPDHHEDGLGDLHTSRLHLAAAVDEQVATDRPEDADVVLRFVSPWCLQAYFSAIALTISEAKSTRTELNEFC